MPLFNCTCGDFVFGGITIEVSVRGDSVEWLLATNDRGLTFDRQAMYETLRSALRP